MSRFASLRFRLLLLVLLAVIPILGLTWYTYLELRDVTATSVKGEALRLARIAASDQEDTIKDTRQLLFALAQLPEVDSTTGDDCSPLFARLLNQSPQYTIIGLVEENGQLLCSAPHASEPMSLEDRSFFEQVLASRDFVMSDYQKEPLYGSATLDFGYPVVDEAGRVNRILFASLDLNWLNQLAAEAQLPEGSTIIVVDREGTILVRYPDPDVWVGQSLTDTPIIQTLLSQTGEGTTEADGVDGVSRLFAFTPISGVPLGEEVYVGIGIPTSVAFAGTYRLLTRNLIGLALVTLLALGAAWFGSNLFILRWVGMLVRAAKRLSTGDLSARTGLPYGNGELGQLAFAFDEMAASLEQRVVERDQAQSALRESQRMLATLMSHLPGMAYRCSSDPDRTIEFASEGGFELTGYRPAEMVQEQVSFVQIIHPEDREFVRQRVQSAVEANKPYQITYRIITAEGEERWVWDQGRRVFSAEQKGARVEGFIADATERVLAQKILEQRVADRTRELTALYDVMAAASASLDLETVLNRSLDRLLKAMQSTVGVIHLLDETGATLRLAAVLGIPSATALEIAAVPVDGGVVGRAIAQGEPLVVEHTGEQSKPIGVMPAAMADSTYLGVPIRTRGQTLGLLSIVREPERLFSAEEISLLVSIADEVGVAVENARLYQQAEQLAVMRERERLARELHDSVTQALYSLTLLSEAGVRLARAGDVKRAEGYLARVTEIGQQALKEMRLLVYELRPLALKREGLAGALQQRLDAVERRAGVEARLIVEGSDELPAEIEEGFYRVAQEALNNALKHASPTSVTVRLRTTSNSAELEVVDDGRGFDLETMNDSGGMGLTSMRERVEKLGGTLHVYSTSGQGCTVQARVARRAGTQDGHLA